MLPLALNNKSFFASIFLVFIMLLLLEQKQEHLSYLNKVHEIEAQKTEAENLAFLRFQLEYNIDYIMSSSLKPGKKPSQLKNEIISKIKNEISFFQSKYPQVSFSYSSKSLDDLTIYIVNTKQTSFIILFFPKEFNVLLKTSSASLHFKIPENYTLKKVV